MPATITEFKPVESEGVEGFLLPVDAVPVDTSGQYFVWGLTGEQGDTYKVQRREVEVGQMTGDSILVTRGLA